MIGYLQGRILLKQPPKLMLDVQGVGYEIEAPMTTFYTLPDVGEDISIYTHLVVRDDAHLLFGFANERERCLFRALLKVSGVGAKMALTILSGMSAEQFTLCIKERDIDRLTRLPGVGKKTAERLAMEMRDRLDIAGTAAYTNHPMRMDAGEDSVNDAVRALISLGYKPKEAARHVGAVAVDGMDSEEIIRQALKALVR